VTVYTCAIETNPSEGDLQTIEDGVAAHDREHAGPLEYVPFAVFVRDETGAVLGGLRGTVGGGWLYIQTLWVELTYRGQKLGTRLVETAEAEALRRGCPRVFLNTLSYQAPSFYTRLGYTVFAELEEAPGPHRRIFMRKELANRADSLS